MKDRPDRQVPFQVLEGFFHGNELDIILPQQRGIALGQIGPEQITSLPAANRPQFLAVEGVEEHGTFLVHLDLNQAAGALARAAPSFMSISSREISMAASWPSRFHSHFRCRRRMARSLVIRSALWAKMLSSLSSASNLTWIPSRTSCHGLSVRCFSSRVRRPLGVPTRYCTGGSLRRISASTSSVGMPRSITQTRRALPYCDSILLRKARKVLLSAVLPGSTS